MKLAIPSSPNDAVLITTEVDGDGDVKFLASKAGAPPICFAYLSASEGRVYSYGTSSGDDAKLASWGFKIVEGRVSGLARC